MTFTGLFKDYNIKNKVISNEKMKQEPNILQFKNKNT